MHLKYTFETIELDDHIIAVPIGINSDKVRKVVKLNETAALIFDMLKVETTEMKIVEDIMKKYDVPLDVLKADVHSYIEAFMKEGLIV